MACGANQYAGNLAIPTLILRPASEFALDSVKRQFEIFTKAGHATHVAENGVHGSSMLNPERRGRRREDLSPGARLRETGAGRVERIYFDRSV